VLKYAAGGALTSSIGSSKMEPGLEAAKDERLVWHLKAAAWRRARDEF
jgi:hypothetical protein